MDNSAQYLWNDLMYFLQSNTKNSADYNIALEFLKRMDDIPHSKIEEFAYHANITPSTITKFCKKLGFDGFNEIKEKLASLEQTESQITYIRNNYLPEQYEDAFLIYDSRLTTLFFDGLKNDSNVDKLLNLIVEGKTICILSPDYSANAVISFAKTCYENNIKCFKISRRADEDLIIELAKSSDLLIVVSSTGKWIDLSKDLLTRIRELSIPMFLVGSDTVIEASKDYDFISPIGIGDEIVLLNSHYNSSKLYA